MLLKLTYYNTDMLANNVVRKRFDFLDIAKALTMFCVIWGHADSGTNNPLYRCLFYAWTMPLFFLISGIVTKDAKDSDFSFKGWLNFLIKNLFALVLPFIIWGFIFSNFNLPEMYHLLYGSYEQIKIVCAIGALWFLPSFFLARVMSYGILNIENKIPFSDRILSLIFGIISIVIGFLLPRVEIGYFFGFNISFMALGFILLGYAMKDIIHIFANQKWWLSLVLFIVFGISFYFGTAFRGENFELVSMFKGSYGNPFWFLLNAFTGSFTIICISILISKFGEKFKNPVNKYLSWVGQNSIGFYLVHVPIIRQLALPLLENAGFTEPIALVAFVAMLISLVMCSLLVFLINLVIPQIFGKNCPFEIKK